MDKPHGEGRLIQPDVSPPERYYPVVPDLHHEDRERVFRLPRLQQGDLVQPIEQESKTTDQEQAGDAPSEEAALWNPSP